MSPSLEGKLMAIRQQVLEEHPSFRMVGVNFICPESTSRNYAAKLNLLLTQMTSQFILDLN